MSGPRLEPLPDADLPFACEPDGGGRPHLRTARVIQCALSRICGSCGQSLGAPVAFLATIAEADAAAIHLPPMHLACARNVHTRYGERWRMLGQQREPASWVVVTTSGFEFRRPRRGQLDPRPVFEPNSEIERISLA